MPSQQILEKLQRKIVARETLIDLVHMKQSQHYERQKQLSFLDRLSHGMTVS